MICSTVLEIGSRNSTKVVLRLHAHSEEVNRPYCAVFKQRKDNYHNNLKPTETSCLHVSWVEGKGFDLCSICRSIDIILTWDISWDHQIVVIIVVITAFLVDFITAFLGLHSSQYLLPLRSKKAALNLTGIKTIIFEEGLDPILFICYESFFVVFKWIHMLTEKIYTI